MTDHDQPHSWEDAHALSGAYAMDALDAQERARFEAHLELCAHCRDEVDGLRETAALLGTGDEVAPPPSVRDRVLADIGLVRPLPPIEPQPEAETAGPHAPTAAPVPTPSGATRSDETLRDLDAHRRRRLARVPLLVAAAAVLLLAVGAAWLRPWAEDPAPRLTVAERVLAAEDADRVDKRFPDGAKATIVVSRSVGRAVILTEDMPPAPEGRDYELWLQTPAGELLPAGLMPDVRDATYVLEGDASRATGVGITVEPDGGSDQPTSAPIAFFPLDT